MKIIKTKTMRHGSLFSGIGGFDLAAEWIGWENVFHCEWMEFPRKVLKYYWPKAISYENICTTDFTAHRGEIDIITGGFPCQPYSSAGKRLGKEDERHLWPEMLRAIREIEPSWVVGENVRGLTNWNGGVVFEEVCADLENLGYEVQPILLPACAVNAPHRRDRIWFVAYSNNKRGSDGLGKVQGENGKISEWNNDAESCDTSKFYDASNPTSQRFCGDGSREQSQPATHRTRDGMGSQDATYSDSKSIESEIKSERRISSSKWSKMGQKSSADGKLKNATNTKTKGSTGHSERTQTTHSINGVVSSNGDASDSSSRRMEGYGRKSKRKQLQTAEFNENNSQQFCRMDWEKFPTQSPVCNGDDGLSSRLDSITFPKWRNESIKGGGNAIVPQVAYQIFKVIELLKHRQ